MKHRVRIDLCFEKEDDARSLMEYARSLTSKAISINEGQNNEEIAFCDYELCGHDEDKAGQRIERIEIKKATPVVTKE